MPPYSWLSWKIAENNRLLQHPQQTAISIWSGDGFQFSGIFKKVLNFPENSSQL